MLTSEANEASNEEKKKTITEGHIMAALRKLDFARFATECATIGGEEQARSQLMTLQNGAAYIRTCQPHLVCRRGGRNTRVAKTAASHGCMLNGSLRVSGRQGCDARKEKEAQAAGKHTVRPPLPSARPRGLPGPRDEAPGCTPPATGLPLAWREGASARDASPTVHR